MQGQKYAVETVPIKTGFYELQIRHQEKDQWQHSVHRQVEDHYEKITLHKVAKHSTLYSFCLSNTELTKIRLSVSLRFGMELLDLKVVAEEVDQEMVDREAKWIEKQADKIEEIVKNSYIKRRDRDEYANLMRKKMIGLAGVGLLVLAGIAGCFYVNLRTIFKERKLM